MDEPRDPRYIRLAAAVLLRAVNDAQGKRAPGDCKSEVLKNQVEAIEFLLSPEAERWASILDIDITQSRDLIKCRSA